MKFLFGKKTSAAVPVAESTKAKSKAVSSVAKLATVPAEQKQIIVGLIFITASFFGAVFLLYFIGRAQSAREIEMTDMSQKLLLASTQKDAANSKVQMLQSQVGRVLDLQKVVAASEKIHGDNEAARKEGSLWVDRKTANCMVTLGVLNGVTKGSRLGVYEGDKKIAIVKVTSALDVVSYVEPVEMTIDDFKKDYFQVKAE